MIDGLAAADLDGSGELSEADVKLALCAPQLHERVRCLKLVLWWTGARGDNHAHAPVLLPLSLEDKAVELQQGLDYVDEPAPTGSTYLHFLNNCAKLKMIS